MSPTLVRKGNTFCRKRKLMKDSSAAQPAGWQGIRSKRYWRVPLKGVSYSSASIMHRFLTAFRTFKGHVCQLIPWSSWTCTRDSQMCHLEHTSLPCSVSNNYLQCDHVFHLISTVPRSSFSPNKIYKSVSELEWNFKLWAFELIQWRRISVYSNVYIVYCVWLWILVADHTSRLRQSQVVRARISLWDDMYAQDSNSCNLLVS